MTEPTALQRSPKIRLFKLRLWAINLVLMVTSGIAIWFSYFVVHNKENIVYHFATFGPIQPSTFLLTLGVLVLLTGIFGCYSTLEESTKLTWIYALSLVVLLILEFAASVAALATRDYFVELMRNGVKGELLRYHKSTPQAQHAMDLIQRELYCCGYEGPNNWTETSLRGDFMDYNNIPSSCCGFEVGRACAKIAAYTDGCKSKIAKAVYDVSLTLLLGLAVIALVQIGGLICAYKLGRLIRKNKAESVVATNANEDADPSDLVIWKKHTQTIYI